MCKRFSILVVGLGSMSRQWAPIRKTPTRRMVSQLLGSTVDGRPLLDVVVPTAAWAEHIAARWADFAAEIGFSGIHWDTLGDKYGVAAMGGDVPGFLRASRPVLMTRGLEQTCNFVDGFGWEPSLFGLSDCNSNTVAFPYWEAWSLQIGRAHV